MVEGKQDINFVTYHTIKYNLPFKHIEKTWYNVLQEDRQQILAGKTNLNVHL